MKKFDENFLALAQIAADLYNEFADDACCDPGPELPDFLSANGVSFKYTPFDCRITISDEQPNLIPARHPV